MPHAQGPPYGLLNRGEHRANMVVGMFMKAHLKPDNSSPQRPVRAALIAFLCMACLCVIGTLVNNRSDDRLLMLLAGLTYSAFMAYFGVGACLLTKRLRRFLLISIISILSLSLAFAAVCMWLVRKDFDMLSPVMETARNMRWVLCAILGLFAFIPALGWRRHFKERSETV